MTRAIIYNSQAQADSLFLRLDNKVKHLFKEGDENYTWIKKNILDNRVAVIIEEYGTLWPLISDELNPNDINLITSLEDDVEGGWFLNDEVT
jgi:hypothetical protein